MKLKPRFYEKATIASVWTILGSILLNGNMYGFDIDLWLFSVLAVFCLGCFLDY